MSTSIAIPRALTLAFFTILACLTLSAGAAAQCGTSVPGGAVVGQTWTLAGSPYCVQGDISVTGLTIGPGVEVIVQGDYRIEVLAMQAQGTAAQPILFTSDNGSTGWKGLRFQNVPPGSLLEHCIVEKANDSGVRIVESSVTLRWCTLRENSVIGTGGGLHATLGDQDLLMEDCTVVGNQSTTHGGGLAVTMTSGTTVLERCMIHDNMANPANTCGGQAFGGGLYMEGGSTLLQNCVARENHANSNAAGSQTRLAAGGGAYLGGGAGAVYELRNCRFTRNRAVTSHCATGGFPPIRYARGGGIWTDATLSARNCVIACNRVGAGNERSGSGTYTAGGATEWVNCTIARNGLIADGAATGVHQGAGTVSVENSIIYWNNQTGAQTYGPQLGGTIDVEYSCVQGSPVEPGIGNINFNPFLGGEACGTWDTRILAFSPCIDAGNPDSAYDDACASQSLGGARNDMGAHGGPGACDFDAAGGPRSYCTSSLNSTGLAALIGWTGSTSVAVNDLVLEASALPANTPGIFIYGSNPATTPFGPATLCVANPVRRLQVVIANLSGVASFALDLSALPGSDVVRPGDVLYFQCWFRDPAGVDPFYNLTDGLEVPFGQ